MADPRHPDAGWSSPVARQAHNLKVAGSNPAPATNFLKFSKMPPRRLRRGRRFALALARPFRSLTAAQSDRAQRVADLILQPVEPGLGELASARATRTAWVLEARSSHQPSAVADADAVDGVDLGAGGGEVRLDLVDDANFRSSGAVEADLGRVERPAAWRRADRPGSGRRGPGCRAGGRRRRARRRGRRSGPCRRCGRTSRRTAARRSRPSWP